MDRQDIDRGVALSILPDTPQSHDLGAIVTALEVAAALLTSDGARHLANDELIDKANAMSNVSLDRDSCLIVLNHMGWAEKLNKFYGATKSSPTAS